LVYGWIIGFNGILEHFSEIELDAPIRLKIWQFTWRIVCDHWLTGTGVGTYRPVVFLYQVFDTDQVQVGAAHNDYLQVASEWGLPFGLLIFFLVWGYWWITAIGVARKSPAGKGAAKTEEKLVRAGALAGSAAFLAHSWVEFNWQIPANQLYFTILLVLMRYRAPAARISGEDYFSVNSTGPSQ
jgi:O-antigen ligase